MLKPENVPGSRLQWRRAANIYLFHRDTPIAIKRELGS